VAWPSDGLASETARPLLTAGEVMQLPPPTNWFWSLACRHRAKKRAIMKISADRAGLGAADSRQGTKCRSVDIGADWLPAAVSSGQEAVRQVRISSTIRNAASGASQNSLNTKKFVSESEGRPEFVSQRRPR